MKTIILAFTMLLTSSHFIAQTMSSVPLAKLDTLHSNIVGEDYFLQISLPYPFNPKDRKYPVMYYLDAFGSSGGINELVKSRMWSKSIDPVIMVGISYNTNPFDYGGLRKRDYLPAINANDTIHKGDDFLNFIKTELIPYMENTYGSDPENRGLLGFSSGGFFCTWVLKQAPELFQKLAIISPSLQYGKGFLLKDSELIKNIKNLDSLEVFLSYGALEGNDFISYGNALHKLLSANEKVHVNKVIFQGETHGSVFTAARTRAILSLYGNRYKTMLREAKTFYRAKELSKSLERYKLAISLYPDEADDGDRYNLARLYALSNDPDNAFNWLAKLDKTYRNWPEKMNIDSNLTSLHEDKRWHPLLKSLENK